MTEKELNRKMTGEHIYMTVEFTDDPGPTKTVIGLVSRTEPDAVYMDGVRIEWTRIRRVMYHVHVYSADTLIFTAWARNASRVMPGHTAVIDRKSAGLITGVIEYVTPDGIMLSVSCGDGSDKKVMVPASDVAAVYYVNVIYNAHDIR